MTGHVAQVQEGSRTCRCELNFDEAIRRDDHAFETVRAKLRSPVAVNLDVDAEEELLGRHGMEFRIVVAEP